MARRIEFDFGGKKKIAQAKKLNLAKGLAFGAVAGSALGALSGLLFAPKSGKDTRQQIKDDVELASKKVADGAKEVGDKAVSGIKDLKEKAADLYNDKIKRKNCCCEPSDSEAGLTEECECCTEPGEGENEDQCDASAIEEQESTEQ